MNITEFRRRLEIKFWEAVIQSLHTLAKRQKGIKAPISKDRTIVILSLAIGLCAVYWVLASSQNQANASTIILDKADLHSRAGLESAILIAGVDQLEATAPQLSNAWLAIINHASLHVTLLPVEILSDEPFDDLYRSSDDLYRSSDGLYRSADHYIIVDEQALEEITSILRQLGDKGGYRSPEHRYSTGDALSRSRERLEPLSDEFARFACQLLSSGIPSDVLALLSANLQNHYRSDKALVDIIDTLISDDWAVYARLDHSKEIAPMSSNAISAQKNIQLFCNLPTLRRQP